MEVFDYKQQNYLVKREHISHALRCKGQSEKTFVGLVIYDLRWIVKAQNPKKYERKYVACRYFHKGKYKEKRCTQGEGKKKNQPNICVCCLIPYDEPGNHLHEEKGQGGVEGQE